MNILLDPNVIYVLLVTGFLLAVLALFSPGTGIIEIAALMALIIAGYGIYNIPFNIWALVLLILGVFPFFFALRRWKNWTFLIVAIAALIIGSIFLFRNDQAISAIHPVLASTVSIIAAGLMWFIGRNSLEAISQPPSFDLGKLINNIGKARTDISPGKDGTVYVMGEEWSAKSREEIQHGDEIRVLDRENLVLWVERVKDTDNN